MSETFAFWYLFVSIILGALTGLRYLLIGDEREYGGWDLFGIIIETPLLIWALFVLADR